MSASECLKEMLTRLWQQQQQQLGDGRGRGLEARGSREIDNGAAGDTPRSHEAIRK